MATELAKAYVQIIPSAEGIKGKLTEALGGEAESAGEAAGKKAGASFGSVLSGAAKAGITAIAAVGTAAVAAGTKFTQAVGSTAAYGDEIDKMSQKMGLSAQAYQEWDAIMQHSGTSIQSMQSSMKTLANAVENGNEAFERIGLTQEEIAKMSNEELFAATIRGLQNVDNETERTYLAGQLLGRGATELGALLNTSAEDTEAMRQRVHELGGVMSDEAVKAAAAYQDSLQDMQTAFSGLSRNMTAEFMPAITGIMDGLTEIFSGDSETGLAMISAGVQDLVGKLTEVIPQLAEIGGTIVTSLAQAIVDNLPSLMATATDIVMNLATFVIDALPDLVKAGLEVIVTLAQSIADSIPELVPTIVDVILEIVATLTDPQNLAALLDAAIAIIFALADGLIEALPELIEQAPVIVTNLMQAIIENAPKLLESAFQLIVKLAEGIIQNLPQILEAGTQMVFSIIEGIVKMLGELVKKGKEIVDSVKDGFFQKVQDAKNWGHDMIKNFCDGIVEKWNKLKESVVGVANGIAGLFHHSHPDYGPLADDYKWMPDMMESFAKGISKNRGLVLTEAERLAGDLNGVLTGREPQLAYAGMPSGPAYGGAGDMRGISAEIRATLEALRGMRVVMDTGETVGVLTSPMNVSLGNQYTHNRRGI